jgi:hypothetical protein
MARFPDDSTSPLQMIDMFNHDPKSVHELKCTQGQFKVTPSPPCATVSLSLSLSLSLDISASASSSPHPHISLDISSHALSYLLCLISHLIHYPIFSV